MMNTRSRKSSTGKRDSTRASSRSAAATPASARKKASTSRTPSALPGHNSKEKDPAVVAREIANCVIHLPGYEEQAKLLRSLLKSTVRHVESNSILVCGARGCGKSTFVEQGLKSECDPNQTEIMYFNGFMDTEATKLFQNMRAVAEAEGRSVSVLMDSLKHKCTSSQSTVIVVLDEFDRFCKHTDQTFLYNIFDLSQKCRQLFVIGMTTRLDCLELLEKRVKSRMNQTVIHLNCPFTGVTEYREFASSISERAGAGNIPVDQELKIQFSKNFSLRNLKHLMIEQTGLGASLCQPSNYNAVVSSMTSLSNMEFLILVVADTYCKNNGVKALPCDAILKEISKFAGRTRISRDLAYKLIDNLTSYGFLKKLNSREHHFLNDWTMLHLNFGTDDLKEALSEMHSSLPANMQLLIHIR